MARSRHPNKEIEAAVGYAESKGWRVVVGGSHAWGFLYCPHRARDGCRLHVWSTPRDPFAHAKDLRRGIDNCRHTPGGQP
jgi:hypothetical protein